MFMAEINGLEVVRDNQKTFELSTSFTPNAIDVHDSLVAVGGEVGRGTIRTPCWRLITVAQDTKVRLYEWDGKSLKETGMLEGNRGPISAIKFSPDGTMVVSGNVSRVNYPCFMRD